MSQTLELYEDCGWMKRWRPYFSHQETIFGGDLLYIMTGCTV